MSGPPQPTPQPPEGPEESKALAPVAPKPLAETASTAVAAQAKASVEARYLMALKSPRTWDTVRVRILAACKRPGFAETARYSKPVGRTTVMGPSIRFAEEALRSMGNVYVESMVVFDDPERRIVRITGTDLEANLSYHTDLLILKTVERSSVRDGQVVVGRRQNTKGQTVYIIEATDDDLLVKQAAMTSKAVRTIGLRLLPGDILEEAMEQVAQTLLNEDAKDPDSARKRLCDAFFALGTSPDDLEEYLGHKLEQTTPAELNLLRTIYQALKDGEATWADVLETKGKTPNFGKADRGAGALKDALTKNGAGSGAGGQEHASSAPAFDPRTGAPGPAGAATNVPPVDPVHQGAGTVTNEPPQRRSKDPKGKLPY